MTRCKVISCLAPGRVHRYHLGEEKTFKIEYTEDDVSEKDKSKGTKKSNRHVKLKNKIRNKLLQPTFVPFVSGLTLY